MPNDQGRFEADTRAGDTALRALEIVTVVLGLVTVALFVWVVAARFVNPIDAEWMTGSVRDQIDRMRGGASPYGPPTASYIPFLYTPIYYWLSAAVARVLPTFVACKVVSLGATAATAWGVARIARSLGASRFWTGLAILLHFGTYSLTLFFYDLERVDALSAAFVVIGLATLLGPRDTSARSVGLDVLGGAILGAAFFAKQPGLLAFVAAVLGLLHAGERKRGLVVLGAGAATFALLAAWLEVSTGGWWRYYCVSLPRTHGVELSLLSTFFVQDLPKAFVLTIGTFAILAPPVRAILRRERPATGAWRDHLFAAVLAGALGGAFFLRSHRGGWANVIIAWTPLACAAVAIAATRAESRARDAGLLRTLRPLLLGGICIQFLGGVFDPNDNSPTPTDVRNVGKLRGVVRELEKEGEVVATTMGSLTRTPHFHAAALFDVLRAGDRAPSDYLAALEARKYAALVVGVPDEFVCDQDSCKELSEITQRNYFVALRLPELPRTGMSGFDGRPRWILRPRKTPLASLDKKALARRQRVEAGLAELRGWARDPDSAIAPDDAIEDLAANAP